jgi:hypothetical protein
VISHHEVQLALRTKLLTLSVATTGSTDLSGTATGYARSAGSFITDGFRVGMEVAGSGFADSDNNTPHTITAVTALALSCADTAVEAEAAGRTLTVGLPTGRAWENLDYEPTQNTPWVEEQYLPGPMRRETLGATAQLEVLPQYLPRIYVPANTGADAARKYADALITLFAPGTTMTTTSGDVLRVRGDLAPFAGQLVQTRPGAAVVPVTVPLRVRTTNSI